MHAMPVFFFCLGDIYSGRFLGKSYLVSLLGWVGVGGVQELYILPTVVEN